MVLGRHGIEDALAQLSMDIYANLNNNKKPLSFPRS